jgi:hypothetical protein
MAATPVFEWACDVLERTSKMTRLQARGTMRLVLGAAGLDAATLTGRQMRVIANKLLGKELRVRAVENPDAVCAALQEIPADVEAASSLMHPSPEDIVSRLGRKD